MSSGYKSLGNALVSFMLDEAPRGESSEREKIKPKGSQGTIDEWSLQKNWEGMRAYLEGQERNLPFRGRRR